MDRPLGTLLDTEHQPAIALLDKPAVAPGAPDSHTFFENPASFDDGGQISPAAASKTKGYPGTSYVLASSLAQIIFFEFGCLALDGSP